MKQHFTDEKTGIRYTLQGDYYLPDLALPAEEQQPIGIWGQRHLRHIKQNRRVLYTCLLYTSFEVTIILYPKWLVGYQNNSQMAVTKK